MRAQAPLAEARLLLFQWESAHHAAGGSKPPVGPRAPGPQTPQRTWACAILSCYVSPPQWTDLVVTSTNRASSKAEAVPLPDCPLSVRRPHRGHRQVWLSCQASECGSFGREASAQPSTAAS